MTHSIELNINGKVYRVTVDPDERLLDTLRDRLSLTGTKEGCGTGDCGACTVLLNGRAVTSCLVLTMAAEGSEVTTIEGVAIQGKLHRVQQAFIDQGGVQCGYCTPGFIVAAKALLDENPRPTEEEIRFHLAGNICRCTGYGRIMAALKSAAG
ncbi:MAG: (2Fe-2S)-binding protein [Chloroflexota bacterium]|nr:MAG: (2Fe-2S)-binding protein [Chloroflexota bacterium]